MAKFFGKSEKRLSIGSAAFLLSSFSLASILLGLLRTSLINSDFNSLSRSAYFAAFKIPDLIFFALSSGALTVAFMPVLKERLTKSGKAAAWRLTSSTLNTLALVSFMLSLVLLIFSPQIVGIYHFEGAQRDLCASIMRIIAVNPFLFSISTVLTSTQQTVGRFFFFALAPLVYNASIILGIVLLKDNLDIIAPAVGVAIGAMLQLIVAALGMLGLNYKYTWGIDAKNSDYRSVMKALPARSIDQGIDYINSIFETRFASALERIGRIGAVSNYENALLLHNAPISLIGIAISSAAFPRFTERIAQGRPDLFRKEFLQVIRAMLWISLPVVVVTFFCHAYLARIIAKTANAEIATLLQYLVVAILFRTLYAAVSRWFYAQKDTRTPLYVSLFSIGLNIFLAYNLSKPGAYGVVGLAMTQSIVAFLEVVVLLTIMSIRDHKLFERNFVGAVIKILSTAGITIIVASLMVAILPLDSNDRGLTLTAKLSIISGITILSHVLFSWVMRLDEVKPVVDKLKKLTLRPLKI
ncbi:virulence factor MviN [Candidatus Saccharibacteria bacterium]|nr:virulence factor MviN [Candidatus Saccharibacteria bacterium]